MLGKVECFKLRPAGPCQARAAGRNVLFRRLEPGLFGHTSPDRYPFKSYLICNLWLLESRHSF